MIPRCQFLHNLPCEQVSDRLIELEDENAKLRAERDEWHRVVASKQDIIDHMRDARAENSKLRELISELYACSQQCGCDRCGYRDGCTMLDRMRGLGIEVGE